VGEQQHPRRNPTRPRTATRSEDLHLEGTCWHHAWAIAARVSSGNPTQEDGSTGRSVASASCPPRTSARLMASATRLRRRSRQWTARPGSGRRSFFSSQLCLCPCWHRCLRLRLIAKRPRVSLTKQEKPRAARPTEPRDSYASGIRIPHLSPSHETTNTWLSGSVSRQASPSARNEEETWLHTKIHKCSGPDSHDEQTPALKVPLQTKLRFRPRSTNNPPHWRACGATNSGRLTSDLCSSSDGPRTDAAAGRLSFASPLKGREPDIKAKESEVGPRVAMTGSSAEKLSPAATTSAPTAASTCLPTPHQRAPAAPKRTGRSSLPSSPRKQGQRTECCTLAGQQQFAFPGMAGGRLLRRAGGWFPPPKAGRRGGPPTRAEGGAPARLALSPSKDDEDP
jgi:hypothetical protein